MDNESSTVIQKACMQDEALRQVAQIINAATNEKKDIMFECDSFLRLATWLRPENCSSVRPAPARPEQQAPGAPETLHTYIIYIYMYTYTIQISKSPFPIEAFGLLAVLQNEDYMVVVVNMTVTAM